MPPEEKSRDPMYIAHVKTERVPIPTPLLITVRFPDEGKRDEVISSLRYSIRNAPSSTSASRLAELVSALTGAHESMESYYSVLDSKRGYR